MRGVDVHMVSCVIHYDFPRPTQSFISRSYRTGRFGRSGVSILFVTNEDKPALDDLRKTYSVNIAGMPLNVADYL